MAKGWKCSRVTGSFFKVMRSASPLTLPAVASAALRSSGVEHDLDSSARLQMALNCKLSACLLPAASQAVQDGQSPLNSSWFHTAHAVASISAGLVTPALHVTEENCSQIGGQGGIIPETSSGMFWARPWRERRFASTRVQNYSFLFFSE